MTHSHKTTQSFTPDIEFWRSIEILFLKYPFCEHGREFDPRDDLIMYYEEKYNEKFGVPTTGRDIYNQFINVRYYKGQKLDELPIPNVTRQMLSTQCTVKINHLGRLIKFFSNSISNADTVHKFQHFFESMYYYLKDIHEINPKIPLIQRHGLDNKTHPNYENAKETFLKIGGGFINPKEYMDYFNNACINHDVPFVMFTLYDQCYVVHRTDKFVEKAIQELPLFLSHPDLKHANELFVEAYKQREKGNDKDCLGKVREGLEAIRDNIYAKHSLTTGNLHNDMEKLFNTYSTTVFDFAKIPETNPTKLNKITGYLRDSILLAVKFGNFGHHPLAIPSLAESNTSYFALGLVASVLPYLYYILK